MLKRFKKIFTLLILLIYFSSTMGLVVSHIHCFCENNDQVKLFSLKTEVCRICKDKEMQGQTKSCCEKKQEVHKEHKGCCGTDVVYLKINIDYNSTQPISILNLFIFYNGHFCFIDPINEIDSFIQKSTFLKEDIPKKSGREIVCYLHQLKMGPAIIS